MYNPTNEQQGGLSLQSLTRIM